MEVTATVTAKITKRAGKISEVRFDFFPLGYGRFMLA